MTTIQSKGRYIKRVFADIEDLKRQIDRKYSYLAAILECLPE